MYPFTPQGVASWQSNLQTATDVQLQQEANQISSNFKSWLTGTFQLEPGQVDFFDGLTAYFVQLMSAKIAFAVANRIPVKLKKPETPTTLRGSKLIRDNSSLDTEEDGQGNTNAEGEIEYEITYG